MVYTIICPHCKAHVRIPENSTSNIFRHGVFYSETLQGDTTTNGINGREVYATISKDNSSYLFFDSNNNVLNDNYNHDLLANTSNMDISLINLAGCGKEFCVKIDNHGQKVAGVKKIVNMLNEFVLKNLFLQVILKVNQLHLHIREKKCLL